jgi:DNA-binding winged helix-turn-helix (wHTH) protein
MMLTLPIVLTGHSPLSEAHMALTGEVLMTAGEMRNTRPYEELSPDVVYSFGAFELAPSRRVLRQDGRPVRIGSRALDILIALVENAGQLVTKAMLVRCAWPTTVVDEANLRVQLVTLRKLLGSNDQGEPFIVTVAGQGYWFSARDLARDTSGPSALASRTPQRGALD